VTADDPEAALRRAEQLLDTHRPQEALRALATTLSQDPDNVNALCLAARAELAAGQPERARDLAVQAVAAAPHSEWPLRLLALSYERTKQPQEAYEAARAAVAAAPYLWQTHHTLAHVACKMFGMSSVAYAAARQAIELAPLEADPHAMLGRAALESGDQATAERALREALRLDPDHAVARNDLGRLQLLRKDHFGAAGHFADAAASDVRIGVAEHNIDIALIAAVERLFFWVWIVMFTAGRLALTLRGSDAIAFGVVTLVALIGLSVWLLRGLGPALRGRVGSYLRLLPYRDRLLSVSVAMLMLSMAALALMCVLPLEWRLPPAIVGVVALIGCRILLAVRARRLRSK
jgi:tetratricopeptide (TPR) repeat protein